MRCGRLAGHGSGKDARGHPLFARGRGEARARSERHILAADGRRHVAGAGSAIRAGRTVAAGRGPLAMAWDKNADVRHGPSVFRWRQNLRPAFPPEQSRQTVRRCKKTSRGRLQRRRQRSSRCFRRTRPYDETRLIYLSFDQDIDPAAVLKTTTVSAADVDSNATRDTGRDRCGLDDFLLRKTGAAGIDGWSFVR